MRATILLLAAWLALCSVASAAPADSPQADAKRLRVVVTGEAPFVTVTAGNLDGLSIRIWQAVAEHLHVEYDLAYVASPDEAVERVSSGQADVAVGTISITASRAQKVHFTQPYYTSQVVAATMPPSNSVIARLVPYLEAALIFCALLIGVLFVVGNIVWIVERRENPEHFPPTWLRGVGSGMWLAIVTLTGVGYGDTVPRTGLGRLVAAIWMILCMLFVSTLTASIASWLTHYNLTHGVVKSPDQLVGMRVAVVQGTAPADMARRYGAQRSLCKNLDDAMTMLLSGSVKAVVAHRTALLYYLHQHPSCLAQLSPHAIELENFGFVVGRNQPHLSELDEALLSLNETGATHAIEDDFLANVEGLELLAP